jgi:F-type H+-transporting ATPase subunit gamma
MPTIRDIKKRIESVSKIRKITSAMEIVAATRLKRVEARILRFRPYAQAIRDMFTNIAYRTKEDHPLLRTNPAEKSDCIIAITADKGLCGAFNENIFNKLKEFVNARRLIIIGRKGRNYYRGKEEEVFLEYLDLTFKDFQKTAEDLTARIIEEYLRGNIRRVIVVFNKFRLQLLGKTEAVQLLPAVVPQQKKINSDYIYEPSADVVLSKIIKAYIENQIIAALLESNAAEEMARMVAMKYATDNADELINDLNLIFHKARQANITREIIEVINAAAER